MSQFSGKRDKSHTEPRYVTEDEIQKLLDGIEDTEDLTLILFALVTGIRRSELITIEVKDLNFDAQSVPIYDEKKDLYRLIVFPKHVGTQVKRYLKARNKRSKYLFPFTIRTVNRKMKKWATLSKIRLNDNGESRISAHWFRHTYIRRSQTAGRDIKVVQQNTGDTEQTILEYYRELTVEDRVKETELKPLL